MERRVRADLATVFLPALMICPTAFRRMAELCLEQGKHRLRSRRGKKNLRGEFTSQHYSFGKVSKQ
jgi:hypothetical protein